jgi:prevent-host-death family protein
MSIRLNYIVSGRVRRRGASFGAGLPVNPHDHANMTIDMKEEIGAGEFKAKCLKILDDVQRRRKQVTILKRGKPVAKLVPVEERPASFIGSMKGTMEILGDIVSPIEVKWEADGE